MAGIDPRIRADRLLHDAESAPPAERDRLIALGHAYATLAVAEETRTSSLIKLLRFVAYLPSGTRPILVAIVRRRLAVFPPDTDDGTIPNGGG